MYVRKAALFHRPRIRIVESSIPALAAAVAAPIRKLCPAKLLYGRPTAIRASLTLATNLGFVKGDWLANLKNVPLLEPRTTTYAVTASTGQSVSPVRPIYTSTPFPNWSVFDFLM